ncbi:MAG: hypothetical protein ACR2PY_02445, partial [Salinispira sp.]
MIQHEELENTSGNSGILGRIFRYAAPHWPLILLSIIFIVLSTGAQLYLPILIQQAVDNDLRPGWVPADSSLSEENYQELSSDEKQTLRIQDWKGVQNKVFLYLALLL